MKNTTLFKILSLTLIFALLAGVSGAYAITPLPNPGAESNGAYNAYLPAASEQASGLLPQTDGKAVLAPDAAAAYNAYLPAASEQATGLPPQPDGKAVLAPDAAAAWTVVPVVHNRDIGSIVDAAREFPHSGFNLNRTTQFEIQPIMSPPTYHESAIGKISKTDLDDSLNVLKMYRFLAGVPYKDTSLTSNLNNISQHAAYYMAVTNQIDHEPNKVSGVPQSFYDIAYEGCSRANITAGFSNLSATIVAQMTEPDRNNIEFAGHRRWLLKPGGYNYGMGYAKSYGQNDDFGGYRSSTYVQEGLGPNNCEPDTFIAWPSPGDFPIQYFVGVNNVSNYSLEHSKYPWSINLGASYLAPSKNTITVTLTRTRAGVNSKTWVFDASTPTLNNYTDKAGLEGVHLAVDNAAYGMRKSIIFKPDLATLGRIMDGDEFNVRIDGLKSNLAGYVGQNTSLAYEIRFFDLNKEMTRSTLTFDVRHKDLPVAGATISIAGASLITGVDGKAAVRLENNRQYNYTVQKDGLSAESGAIAIGEKSVTKTIDINIPVTFSFSDTVKTYNGGPQGLTVQPSIIAAYRVTYNGVASLPADAGIYNVVAEVTESGFAGRAETTFIIGPAPLTAIPADMSVAYGDAPPVPSVAYVGLVGADAAQTTPNIVATYELGEPGSPGGRHNAGVYKDKVTVNAKNYDVTVRSNTLTITPKALALKDIAVFDREYSPGGTDALINKLQVYNEGVFEGDDVFVDYSGAAARFEDSVIGDGKTVYITGLALGGEQSANYVPANTSLSVTANIKAALTAGDVAAAFKYKYMSLKNARTLTLPEVPAGFEIFIEWTGDPDILSLSGNIRPVAVAKEVNVRFAIRRTAPQDSGGELPDSGDNLLGAGLAQPSDYAQSAAVTIRIPAFTQYRIGAFTSAGGVMTDMSGKLQVTGAGNYFIGDTAVLKAVSMSAEYKFSEWKENGSPVAGAGADYSFTAAKSRTLEACFVRVSSPPPPPPPGPGGGGGGGSGPQVSMPPATPKPTPTPTLKPSPTPVKPQKTPAAERKRRKTAVVSKNPDGVPVMSDIGPGHWASEQIAHLAALGVVNGYPKGDGTFLYMPERLITRAEFMKLIAASLELPLIENYDGSRFADWGGVAGWAKPYVAALIKAGIVMGSNEGGKLFIYPEDNVTREEMTAMAIRALGAGAGGSIGVTDGASGNAPGNTSGSVPGGLPGAYVTDFADVHDWAAAAVNYALAENLTNTRDKTGEPVPPAQPGKPQQPASPGGSLTPAQPGGGSPPPGSLFQPSAPARRDEAAFILSRILIMRR